MAEFDTGTSTTEYYISNSSFLFDSQKIQKMLRTCEWSKNVPIEYVKRFLNHCLCFGVYLKNSNEQVGFGRVISDYTTYAYVTDIVIDTKNRKKGLGTKLFDAILYHSKLQGLKKWSLKITKDSENIYKRRGFQLAKSPSTFFEKVNLNIYCEKNFINLYAKKNSTHIVEIPVKTRSLYYISTNTSKLDLIKIYNLLRETVRCHDIALKDVENLIKYSLCFALCLKSTDEIVGFVRVISDFTTDAYITDLVIDKKHNVEKNEIKKMLIDAVLKHHSLQGLKEWMVRINDDSMRIFINHGFTIANHPEIIFEKTVDTKYNTPV